MTALALTAGLLDDPAVMGLPLALRGVWVTAVAIAARHGRGGLLPPAAQFALMARMEEAQAEKALAALIARGLIAVTPAGDAIGGLARVPASRTAAGERDRKRRQRLARKEKAELSPPVPRDTAGQVGTRRDTRDKRARDPVWDEVLAACGIDPDTVSATAAPGYGKAISSIKQAGAYVPGEAGRRAANYRLHFEDAALTPHALDKHWALCDRRPGRAAPAAPPPAPRPLPVDELTPRERAWRDASDAERAGGERAFYARYGEATG